RTDEDRCKFNDSQQAACRALREDVPDLNQDGTVDSCPRDVDSEQIDQRGLDVGVNGRIAPSTEADVKVGYLNWDFQNTDTKPFTGISLAAKLDHTFNRRTRATLDLGHTPLQASGLVTGYYIRTDGTFGLERSFTQQTYLRAALSVRRYEYSGASTQEPFSFIDYSADTHVPCHTGGAGDP